MAHRIITRQAGRGILGTNVLAAAGGALDAWVYLDHGHVFANAQTGNVVLFAIHVAAGDFAAAARHLPSMGAFIVGITVSQLIAAWLTKRGFHSRNVRLAFECASLVGLALVIHHLSDTSTTAIVGFIAAVQITSLSNIGELSFNTGMTTGNLRSAVSSSVAAWLDPGSTFARARAFAFWAVCLSFMAGALLGGYLAAHVGDDALYGIAALVAVANLILWRLPDPFTASILSG